ncbi:MAG: hypothetical protein ACKVPY_16570 [Paracoccaceae bacterium]
MLWFSFLSDVPFGASDPHLTLSNYGEFFGTATYASRLWKSLKLGFVVTTVCVIVGFPCALSLPSRCTAAGARRCSCWSS